MLYIRDDDYRLSFRYGNFATLTNLKPRDIARIIEYRLSPLYVSVHATDPPVRRYLLRNPTAPDILPQLRDFADHGIQFHTQIVMSPFRLQVELREVAVRWPCSGCARVCVASAFRRKISLREEPSWARSARRATRESRRRRTT